MRVSLSLYLSLSQSLFLRPALQVSYHPFACLRSLCFYLCSTGSRGSLCLSRMHSPSRSLCSLLQSVRFAVKVSAHKPSQSDASVSRLFAVFSSRAHGSNARCRNANESCSALEVYTFVKKEDWPVRCNIFFVAGYSDSSGCALHRRAVEIG